MELDVHLTREADEPWGFELDGGRDCEVPLSIAQVKQFSYSTKPTNKHVVHLSAGQSLF